MSDSTIVTLKEIASRLGLPESSLRKYRDLFPQFIPSVGYGRDRKYREDATEVFRAIREMREEGELTWVEMSTRLAARFPTNPVPPPRAQRAAPEPASPSDVESRLEVLEKNSRRLLSLMESQQAMIAALGAEFLGFKNDLLLLRTVREDAQVTRRTMFSINEQNLKSDKEARLHLLGLLDKVTEMHGLLSYLARTFETFAVAGVSAARESEAKRGASAELMRELETARDRLGALRRENEQLRARLEGQMPVMPGVSLEQDAAAGFQSKRGMTVLFRRSGRPKKGEPPVSE